MDDAAPQTRAETQTTGETRAEGMAPLDRRKFRDAHRTAAGERRARVAFRGLHTLWVNTGTLCNFTCRSCYMDSSPTNDRLAYLTAADLRPFLDEIAERRLETEEIGFTGGEPFMNPDIVPMLDEALSRGFRALVLTNATTPMRKLKGPLSDLKERYGERLVIRVSLDHYAAEPHELERGPDSFAQALAGLAWLVAGGFAVRVAGRTRWDEPAAALRRGYARLFRAHGIPVDAADREALVLFPEMDEEADVPEITEGCWGILGVDPGKVMCATSRMVAKRKGAERPVVLACTLITDDPAFEMGGTLAEAARPVALNHPHCARFCVLGGGSCGRG